MTVSYTAEVSSCRGFGCFLKLLLRWKASVYKLIWTDLLFFLTLYYCLSAVYRLILDEDQKRIFEKVVEFCRTHTSSSPLSFVLGFYVAVVMNRWWDQYISIPWPDSIAVFVSATIHGHDERARLMRRTIVRYVCVCLTLVLTNVSPRVKKRFPTLEHYVDAGLLLENELAIFQSLNFKFPKPSKHWLPIVWASSIVTRARKEGRIRDDFAVKTLLDELNQFRSSSGSLYNYDVISIPLVYTQVVTIAVYAYFLTNIIGQQSIVGNAPNDVISFFPVFIILEIFFYMGWLKVAETLINPFGEDDDDFEVNWIVDRNLQVSYLIVDEMHHEHPELIRDQYWDEVFPTELPYTAASEPFREEYPEPSTACIQLSAAQQEFQPSSVKMDGMEKEPKFGKSDVTEDATSGLNFEVKFSRSRSQISNKDKMFNCGSVTSSISGSFKRINSVNELIDKCKRFLGKDDRPDETNALGGSPLIIDTIEELNEQMTMISSHPENRLEIQNARSQIEPLPASAPIDIPQRSSGIYSIDALSSSAPTNYLGENSKSCHQKRTQMSVPVDNNAVSMANYDAKLSAHSDSSSNNSEREEDEFEKLKFERCKQRLEKLQRNFSKCASSESNTINPDGTTVTP